MITWKPVPGFEGYYVSNTGLVRSEKRGKSLILKPSPSKKTGYHRVCLRKDGKPYTKYVHIIVCEAFHGPKPTPEHEVNHKDLDKGHNHEKNLEWLTHAENIEHAMRVAPHKFGNTGKIGSLNHQAKCYLVVSPKGEAFTIKGLRNFCKNRNLDAREMSRLASKQRVNHRHKGWSCQYC